MLVRLERVAGTGLKSYNPVCQLKKRHRRDRFFGRTENAVLIRLLKALISYLRGAVYKQAHGLKQSLWDCLCLVRATLFQRPELDESPYRQRRRQTEQMARPQPGLFA